MSNPVYRFSDLLIMLYEQPIFLLIALVVLCVCLIPPFVNLYVIQKMCKNNSSAQRRK